VTVVIDSGATSHFVQESDKLPYLGKSNKNVYLPDGNTIQATHTVSLPFDTLNAAAREAHVLPELRGNSLLSVPILATHGYTTVFHAGSEGVEVYQKDAVKISATTLPVLQGWREQSGLWKMGCRLDMMDAETTPNDHAQNVYDLPSVPSAIRYLHAAAGYPTKATWLKAIKAGNYASWPGVTVESVNAHFPESVETIKGHTKKQ
jgi:hypothetical protein